MARIGAALRMRWGRGGQYLIGLVSAALLVLVLTVLTAGAQGVVAEERWESNFGPVTLQFLAAPSASGTTPLRGSWDQGGGHIGEIRSGTYNGATRVLEFTYYQAWNNQNGTGRFTLASDGLSAPGTYTQGSGSGGWTLTRSQPSVLVAAARAPTPTTALAAPTAPAAAGAVVAEERWDSNFGPVVFQFLAAPGPGRRVEIRGSWDQGGGRVGEIRSGAFDGGRVIEITYYQAWNNQNGRARFELAADGLSATGTYTQDSGSGAWTLTRAQRSVLVPAQPAAPAAPAAMADGTLFDNWNRATVNNGPPAATTFRLDQSMLVTRITNYHWNGGRGATPGTIALRAADGVPFGPWPARGTSGTGGAQNVNWIVEPNAVLPAGVYTVVDSDTGTWSHNGESGGRGFTSVQGRLPGAPAEVPQPVRAAIAAQGFYEETWDSEWGPTTLYYVGIIEPPGGQLAVMGTWQQPSGMGACRAEEGYCTGQIDGGVFDLATGTLQFKYFQPWNETPGVGLLQLAPDGRSLTGTYAHESGASGPWTMGRSEPSVATR